MKTGTPTAGKPLVSFLLAVFSLANAAAAGAPDEPKERPKPTAHKDRIIEGWTVRVDNRLLGPRDEELGKLALRFLEAKLFDIKTVVPADRVTKLQSVVIVLDLSHGKLRAMQYHPSAEWLKANEYSADLEKCVHIPRAADLPTRECINEQPWVILHELAHAYHDQVLGFDEPRIKKAYENYKKSGHGDATLLFNGKRVKHYALTDHKEFFAEMTESYFGVNDFFPFNRAELKEAEPDIFALLKDIWESPSPVKPSGVGAAARAGASKPIAVTLPTQEQCREYTLDPAFYKKTLTVQNILIAAADTVSDHTLHETAFQLDRIMNEVRTDVAQRVRDKKVLCLIVGYQDLVSEMPQFHSDKKGKELDFYNWRSRGFLELDRNGHPTVLFAEEDVMHLEGGQQVGSILIHEFGHVIHGAGFDRVLQDRLTKVYQHARDAGLWADGFAAQKFRRVKSEVPVGLLDALVKSFPAEQKEFLAACMDGGDILVNGKPCNSAAKVTKDDQVLIVFGGPKQTYALSNRAEYWAELFQCWYDANRVHDHDHNDIQTRTQLKKYDPEAAALLADVLGDHEWRFVSPKLRSGKEHLAGYTPITGKAATTLEHIDLAAQDHFDKYWKDYWKRLHDKHPGFKSRSE